MKAGSKKDVLIANYHKPYPPRDGADRRCIDLIKAFQALGYNVILFSSDLFQPFAWTKEVVEQTEAELTVQVFLYRASNEEKSQVQSKRLKWNEYSFPGLKDYFKVLHKALQPDIVLVNYVFWADLVTGNQFKRSIRIIDAIDLLSLNQKMAAVTIDNLNKGKVNESFQYLVDGVNEEVLSEDFFSSQNFTADKEEFNKYDNFDITIAINSKEKKLIQLNTTATKCIYLPFSFAVNNVVKTYTDPPIFAIGPNQFNYQGYLYFVTKVLPVIMQKSPGFVLNVLGDGCKQLQASKGINMLGFVPSLNAVYAKSKFAVCPLIGATGQQLKVMEAMANALPVVALRNVAERCPIIHRENGLIADNAEEFAAYTLELYSNPDLCERLGRAAQKTIAQEFTTQQLVDTLGSEINAVNKANVNRPDLMRKQFWKIIFSFKSMFRKIHLKYEQSSFSIPLAKKVMLLGKKSLRVIRG